MDLPTGYVSLFAGVEGLGLALKLAVPGASCRVIVEREMYAIEILASRMQDAALDDAPIWDDVTTFDGKAWRGVADTVIAGWPCPPVSVAGKRLGIHDERWLWPEVRRIIRETDARWFFGENVPGLLSANDGAAAREVFGDLAAMGFTATWGIFSAAQVGSPQKRERLFVLAYRESGMPRRAGRGRAARNGAVDCEEMAIAGNNGRGDANREAVNGGRQRTADRSSDVSGREERRADQSDANAGIANDALGNADGPERRENGAEDGSGPGRSGERSGASECCGESLGNAASINGRERERFGEREASSTGRGESRVEGSGTAMGDAASIRERGETDEADSITDSWDAWGMLAGTSSDVPCWPPGMDGVDVRRMRNDDGLPDARLGVNQVEPVSELPVDMRRGDYVPPYWPPGPADRAEWERLIAIRPDLAPATVEPAICRASSRLPSGLGSVAATRTDELRALGNGVVASCGAVAFLILLKRLMDTLDENKKM